MRRKKNTSLPGQPPVPGSGTPARLADKSPRLRADRHMLGEAFAAEAFDGLNSQPGERHLDANLDDLKQRLQQRIAQQKKRRDKWVLPFGMQPYVIAASLGLVLVCAVVVLFNTKYMEKTQAARQPDGQADQKTASRPLAGSQPYEIKGRSLPETPRAATRPPAPAGGPAARAEAGRAVAAERTPATARFRPAPPVAVLARPRLPVQPSADSPSAEQTAAAPPRPENAPEADRKAAAPARKTAADTPAPPAPAPAAPVPAQATRTVRGRVVDAEDGLAIPGVLVTVRGTDLAARTDAKGDYEITAPADAELAFSFIGYTTYRTPVGRQATLDARLTPDVKSLGEVVVTTAEPAAPSFEPALPPGGKPEYVRRLAAQIAAGRPQQPPPAAVRLSFTVLPDGRPSDVKVLKSNCPPCDSAAVRAVHQAGAWTPARRNGSPVAQKVKLTVPAEKR